MVFHKVAFHQPSYEDAASLATLRGTSEVYVRRNTNLFGAHEKSLKRIANFRQGCNRGCVAQPQETERKKNTVKEPKLHYLIARRPSF